MSTLDGLEVHLDFALVTRVMWIVIVMCMVLSAAFVYATYRLSKRDDEPESLDED